MENSELKKENIGSEINRMVQIDQEMRRKGVEVGDLDQAHSERMKEIIEKIGWPTMSKIGAEASHRAWLLIQHSPDINFQKKCLELMKQESTEEVDKKDIAYLEDRINILEGKPQRYGTQFKKEGDAYVEYPIENIEKIDELRSQLGMESLADYQKTFYAIKNN